LLAELDRRGLREKTDLILVSDHGFSTIASGFDTAARLREAGLKAYRTWTNTPANGDIVVIGTGGSALLYVIGRQKEVIQKAVTTLQQDANLAVIFTRDGLPGTFPLSEVRLDVDHAADIVVTTHWRPGTNRFGVPGHIIAETTTRRPTGGTHGTLGPTDLHNTGLAWGPDFKRGFTNSIPTGNVDITPTLLWLLGITPAQPRDGRVLFEALAATNAPMPRVETRTLEAKTEMPGGTWSQSLSFTEVNGTRYFDEGAGAFIPTPTNAPPASR
jgi:arylsulfatase A-like enzyme